MIAESIIVRLKKLYAQCGLSCDDFVNESEGQEYNASRFTLNRHEARFRTGKITPKKIGQFVTLWKRNAQGITEPYSENDRVDFFMIWLENDKKCGFFLFPRKILIQEGVFSSRQHSGKRGMRIYSPWDVVGNKQAQKTQLWQQKHFIDVSENLKIDCDKLKTLFLGL